MTKHIHYKLLRKCKKNDKKAQFEIYKLYYKGMYNVSFRILQNQAEAEDAMQEAFLSAFDNLSTWSEEVTFGAWLKRIVVNKSLDYLKKKKMQLSTLDDKVFVQEEDIDNENQQTNLQKVELIKYAINNLPEKYRLISIMFLFEGYTHEEISECLNITSQTSRVRFLRAKKMILNSTKLKNELLQIELN